MASKVRTMTVEEKVNGLVQKKQFQEALSLLENLARGPKLFWALKMTGIIYHDMGRFGLSSTSLGKALAINPDDIEANLFMASACHNQGENDAAVTCLETVCRQQHNNYHALRLLSLIAISENRADEALRYTAEMVKFWEDDMDSCLFHGQALLDAGRTAEAIGYFDRVIGRHGDAYQGYYCKAKALVAMGDTEEAFPFYRQAGSLAGGFVAPSLELAALYQKAGKIGEAMQLYDELRARYPDNIEVLNQLAGFYIKCHRVSEAIELLERSAAVAPGNGGTMLTLSGAYKAVGDLERCMEYTKKALALLEPDPSLFSTYLLNTNYLPQFTNREFLEEHKKWDAQFARKLPAFDHAHHDYSADRKLRIGYISADLKNHAVYYVIEPFFRQHDKSGFELYCYYNNASKDHITKRFEALADQWRDVYSMSDARLAQTIYDDNIDILIDLSGHTGGNRLPVLAMKPAPVQVEYEAYPNTTGLGAIDYKLTDDLLDMESDQQWHTEKLRSLGECFICYQPNPQAPDIQESPPCESNGYVTFGSFSNLYKINKQVVRLWSRVLHRVPGSRLLIMRLSINEFARKRFESLFEKEGIDSARLDFVGEVPDRYRSLPAGTEIMALMSECDVMLDTLPYNNHTIALEALWMGVPVITLYGDRHAARVCSSIVNAAGHSEFIARSEEEYIEKAATIAADRRLIAVLRKTLRDDFRESILMNFPAFTARLEQAYREIWSEACQQKA
ncbi:MAG TPA: tetratricopeptide repeat protein [Gammaproteobacteria bacterium]|nr:tetratricopeptide repeat protein [Gammaproteobacteria bacterium]